MHPRPRLKSSLRAEIVDDDGVYILGEDQSHLLRGQAFIKLAPLLDGHSTEEELCQRLGERLSPAEVLYALTLLRQGGFLAQEEAEGSASEAAFWEGLGVAPSQARERLRTARVELLSCGRGDPSWESRRGWAVIVPSSSPRTTSTLSWVPSIGPGSRTAVPGSWCGPPGSRRGSVLPSSLAGPGAGTAWPTGWRDTAG